MSGSRGLDHDTLVIILVIVIFLFALRGLLSLGFGFGSRLCSGAFTLIRILGGFAPQRCDLQNRNRVSGAVVVIKDM